MRCLLETYLSTCTAYDSVYSVSHSTETQSGDALYERNANAVSY